MSKKTLTLGIALAILIALAFIYQGPLKDWQNNLGKPKNILAKVDLAKIDKIEVISGDSIAVLTKQTVLSSVSDTAKWKYNNSKDFYVDPEIMSNILKNLDKMKAAEFELISNNSERKSEFKVDNTGLKVKVYQIDKKVADFVIGDRASDYLSSYISAAESPATHSIKVNLRDAFEQTEWRDLIIFSTAQEKINKIRFQYPNREFTVELKADKWSGVLPEKFTVNKDKIEKILQIMSNLKALEIPEQSFENTGLEKHLIIIEATGEAINNTLMIGESRDGLYYAKRGDSDNIYLINRSERDELDKWIWQLR